MRLVLHLRLREPLGLCCLNPCCIFTSKSVTTSNRSIIRSCRSLWFGFPKLPAELNGVLAKLLRTNKPQLSCVNEVCRNKFRSCGTSPVQTNLSLQRIEICLPKNGVEKNVSFDLSLHVTLNAFRPKALLKKQPQLEKSKTLLEKRYAVLFWLFFSSYYVKVDDDFASCFGMKIKHVRNNQK